MTDVSSILHETINKYKHIYRSLNLSEVYQSVPEQKAASDITRHVLDVPKLPSVLKQGGIPPKPRRIKRPQNGNRHMYVCGFTSNRSLYPSTSSTQPVPVPAFSTIERYRDTSWLCSEQSRQCNGRVIVLDTTGTTHTHILACIHHARRRVSGKKTSVGHCFCTSLGLHFRCGGHFTWN